MEKIIEIIKNSKNRREALIALNWDAHTTGYRKLNDFMKK